MRFSFLPRPSWLFCLMHVAPPNNSVGLHRKFTTKSMDGELCRTRTANARVASGWETDGAEYDRLDCFVPRRDVCYE